MLSQLPPSGVKIGRIPRWKHQMSQSGFLCPVRLSITSSKRKGGKSALKVAFTVTPAYEAELLRVVRLRSRSMGLEFSLWTLQRLADYMAEETGIRVEAETVRQYLAKHDIVLSRPQHKISSPDPE
jgi:transposase